MPRSGIRQAEGSVAPLHECTYVCTYSPRGKAERHPDGAKTNTICLRVCIMTRVIACESMHAREHVRGLAHMCICARLHDGLLAVDCITDYLFPSSRERGSAREWGGEGALRGPDLNTTTSPHPSSKVISATSRRPRGRRKAGPWRGGEGLESSPFCLGRANESRPWYIPMYVYVGFQVSRYLLVGK